MWTVGGGDRSTNVLIGIRTALTPFSVKKTGLSMLSSLANDCRRQSDPHFIIFSFKTSRCSARGAEQDFSNEWVTSEWLHPCLRLSMLQNDSPNNSVLA